MEKCSVKFHRDLYNNYWSDWKLSNFSLFSARRRVGPGTKLPYYHVLPFILPLALSLCTTRLQDGCTRLVKHNSVKIDLRKYITTMLDCSFNIIWAALRCGDLFTWIDFSFILTARVFHIMAWDFGVSQLYAVPIYSRKAFVICYKLYDKSAG